MTRATLAPERESAVRAALAEALEAGRRVLAAGGTSLDAVTAAVKVLEDSPHFNAGKGAVFTSEGTNELDASIMDGAARAGAVAGVTTVKNPIEAARAVMERSRHVLLAGKGADRFATEQGLAIVDPSYFRTEERWQSAPARRPTRLAEGEAGSPARGDEKLGTVGAVALDQAGNLAAATSTGGISGKRFGRVGDSPVIGAGTWAENESVAVSATGTGEMFLRGAAAHDIAALVKYRGSYAPQGRRRGAREGDRPRRPRRRDRARPQRRRGLLLHDRGHVPRLREGLRPGGDPHLSRDERHHRARRPSRAGRDPRERAACRRRRDRPGRGRRAEGPGPQRPRSRALRRVASRRRPACVTSSAPPSVPGGSRRRAGADPVAGLRELARLYAEQRYPPRPGAALVTRQCARCLPRSSTGTTRRSSRTPTTACTSSPCAAAASSRATRACGAPLGFGAAVFANLAGRRHLRHFLERTVFHDARDRPPFLDGAPLTDLLPASGTAPIRFDAFDTHAVALERDNLREALVASAAIPP